MTSSLSHLLSSPGWDLLQAWEARPERKTMDPLALGSALRSQGVSNEVAAAVLGQLSLRDSAEDKFGPIARHMVFTRDGLEQATRFQVAALHAQRMRDAGVTYLADLGCGIGTESLAAAGLGMCTLSVDIDPESAAAASANLRDFPSSEVLHGDVTDLDLSALSAAGVDAIFADPARRSGATKGATRISNPECWAPPLSTVLEWRHSIPALGVKVAPGIAYEALPDGAHVQWTSVDGCLVEAALWCGPLAIEGPGRSAQVIHGTSVHVLRDTSATQPYVPRQLASVGTLGAYLAEPDDAVIRCGAIAQLAFDTSMHLIDEKIAYLSGDQLPHSPFMSSFEVLEVTALRPKHIAAALKTLDVGRVEIKKRGADIDPATLRRSLKMDGSGEATVFATRIGGEHRAIIARRLHTHD
ncbi:THUMP-like domain-containing protein [Schaalia suimastitidis]|uniref:THUMP-like domain-containing protein n=1 Tax=Schaalia suimastitidis TaxID=121163 RepID=UPI00041E4D95|nr:class I SAM-dependent methyltransferase [Schaalia suimastitidis]